MTFRDCTPLHLRAPIAALARALRPFLSSAERGPTRCALEVARNCAQALALDPTANAHACIEEALVHRHRHGWVRCADFALASWLGAAAWRRAVERTSAREAA